MLHISVFNAFEILFYNTSDINTISFKIFFSLEFLFFTSDKIYRKYTCKLAYRDQVDSEQTDFIKQTVILTYKGE